MFCSDNATIYYLFKLCNHQEVNKFYLDSHFSAASSPASLVLSNFCRFAYTSSQKFGHILCVLNWYVNESETELNSTRWAAAAPNLRLDHFPLRPSPSAVFSLPEWFACFRGSGSVGLAICAIRSGSARPAQYHRQWFFSQSCGSDWQKCPV